MRILFVHTNFPGQFGKLAEALQAAGHEVRALRPADVHTPSPVPITTCAAVRQAPSWHQNLLTARFEADVQRGLSARQAAAGMAANGFAPDIIIGHPAFGETLFLAEVWPHARRIVYAENYVSPDTLTAKFDPEFPPPTETELFYARTQSAAATLTLTDADRLVSPTVFQRETFPAALHSRIEVIPDGVDSAEVRPRADAHLALPGTDIVARAGDEIVTYVNRHLEPVRGIHIFLRALALILAERPNARAIIIGAPHAHNYGRAPPTGQTWIEMFMREVGPKLDMSRVHFLRTVDRATGRAGVSLRAHIPGGRAKAAEIGHPA
jgi:glycosyltransferase involved in cell wall biosynthesis